MRLHVVLPNDIDDPATPSGGNAYDRRLCRGLAALGWTVREHAVYGRWPSPRAAERAGLAAVLAGLPDGALVLLDGLVGAAVPEVLAPQARRLRLVMLVHMPLCDDAEERALACTRAVVSTSAWTARLLARRYGLAGVPVHVATPGVDRAGLAPGSAGGTSLLCVVALTPNKGYDVLVDALATVADLPWDCVCVGSPRPDPGYAERLRGRIRAHRLGDRVHLAGPRTGDALDAAYAAADLLVLATRGETYGMVVVEALARGIPVLATEVGGLPEALGEAPGGGRPGLLVPVDDPAALAGALRRWLTEPDLRDRLRGYARQRRTTLTEWTVTAEKVSMALQGVPA